MKTGFIDSITKLAVQAGFVLMKYRESGFLIEVKGGRELVTEADFHSEYLLKKGLTGILPGSAFVGEESWNGLFPAPPFWIVDPLDGTNNFANGIPFFCVSIALVDDEGVCLGCIHDPVHSETFTAMRGGGAFLNEAPIKVSDASMLCDVILATGFPYTRTADDLTFDLGVLRNFLGVSGGIRRCGSAALDMAYTASGRYGGFWEESLKPWDMAAGALLVREAGGKVADFHGAHWNIHSKGIRCTAPGLWDEFSKMFPGTP